jgi:hypothetical protein
MNVWPDNGLMIFSQHMLSLQSDRAIHMLLKATNYYHHE